MKRISPYFFTLLLITTFSNTCFFAQDLSLNAGSDFVSRYIWRGMDVNNQPNVQPYMTLKYTSLQFGFWGSYGLSHLNSNDENSSFGHEIDTWLSYSFGLGKSLTVTALITDYYYPNGGIKIGNFNNYDNTNGPGAHTLEAGAVVAGDESFPLSLSCYLNIYNDRGKNAYFQADYSTAVNDINIGMFLGAAAGSKDNPDYYGTDKFNIVNLGIKISKSLKITETFSLPVYCSYILNPSREISFLVFGISI